MPYPYIWKPAYKGAVKFTEEKIYYRTFVKPIESTSSFYLLLWNAFNSYMKLIFYHTTTFLFFLI